MQKARNIAATYQLPIVGVHHMEAHALVARYNVLITFYELETKSSNSNSMWPTQLKHLKESIDKVSLLLFVLYMTYLKVKFPLSF